MIGDANVADRAKTLLERITLAFSEAAFSIGTRQLRVNVSIGVALYPRDCATAEELLGNADLALYQAKAAGRGRFVFFNAASATNSSRGCRLKRIWSGPWSAANSNFIISRRSV